MAHHLETVLGAARELTEWKDIVFLLVGDGAERSRLVAMRDDMSPRMGNYHNISPSTLS